MHHTVSDCRHALPDNGTYRFTSPLAHGMASPADGGGGRPPALP